MIDALLSAGPGQGVVHSAGPQLPEAGEPVPGFAALAPHDVSVRVAALSLVNGEGVRQPLGGRQVLGETAREGALLAGVELLWERDVHVPVEPAVGALVLSAARQPAPAGTISTRPSASMLLTCATARLRSLRSVFRLSRPAGNRMRRSVSGVSTGQRSASGLSAVA